MVIFCVPSLHGSSNALTPKMTITTPPLNQILYGPPGTGKTYSTVDAALEILDPECLAAHRADRSKLSQRFRELCDAQLIRFVTFHQSFSYEDFVEGLRAEVDQATKQVKYEVVDGVFKGLCRRTNYFAVGQQFGESQKYEVIRVGTEILELRKPNKNFLPISIPMLESLANAARAGKISVEDIEEKRTLEKLPGLGLEPFLVNGYNNVFARLVSHMLKQSPSVNRSARVLVIDEINRGNISKIFGELITLIEPTKREGASDALQAVLPYSRDSFSIPSNVYIIGTMNTADRSLATLDIALRRRFVFREMPPKPELLEGVLVEGVEVDKLLKVINQRIEALLDRDHCLGHAYFLPLRDAPTLSRMAAIFQNQILPLLQEYFFEDWERIQWVLNDHRKSEAYRFVQSTHLDVSDLFGEDVTVSYKSKTWVMNANAFSKSETYKGVIDHTLA